MNDNLIIYEVKGEEIGKKLNDYLREVQRLSGRFVRTSVREGRVKVNNKPARLSSKVVSGDKITIKLNKKEEQNIKPEKMDLDIVYEDSDVIVVNKQPGMVVHPTKSYQEGTLSNGLLYYFREKEENCIVRLVSRLDRDTSGLIIVAKNQFSHMALARDMQTIGFEKSYLAIVHENLKENCGTIDLPIYRNDDDGIKRVVDERGQKSVTHFNVVESFKEADLVKLTLETGRTHQIRVHLSHLGHPLFGDSLYGKDEDTYIKRQALHAYRLVFPHPRDGRKIELESDLPEDMKELVSKLKRS
ncbi:RluA family pseudouridine synthase [Haloimpatiens sp. FM7330]|uniref:RluA family pseudouridine synthase n=1 Tax=Haloimpatiens sp. FM7330 TaxID=3298610 RepID=UPI00363ED512